MALGVAIFLAGLIMVYLGVTNTPFGEVAKQFASGQTIKVPYHVVDLRGKE
jgi:hypothetical protein